MRTAVLVGILWWACLMSCAAESYPFRVETFPPGAALHDQFGGFIGRSGVDLQLKWPRTNGPLQLRVSLPSHQTGTYTLTQRELAKGRYPVNGQLRLAADDLLVAAWDLVRYRGLFVVSGLAGLGLAIGAGRRLLGQRGAGASGRGVLVLGDYELLELIGQGGMSEVYRARRRDSATGEQVAVKIMHLELADPQSSERFRREIKAHLALSHGNLPALIDWGEHKDGRLYLVMELLEGETLKERLRRERVLPDDKAATILTAVGAALDHLHDKGFVHRDVKPSNVFLLSRGGIKLTDMGIAQDLALAPLTRTGSVVGTPHYMAPEQISGQAVPASDQYALGVMAFEILAGRRPFVASQAQELLQQQLGQAPPSIGEYRPQASPALEEALHHVLAKNPKARYQSCGSAAEAIGAALTDACPDETLA